MNKRYIVFLFYSGILISSIGTFAFNMALIAFMLKSNFTLAEASLIIALQRFVPMIFMALWGHLSDLISPRRLVACAEIVASLASLALFFIWQGSETNYLALLFVCVVRSIVVSFQIGSRQRINKFFSDDSYSANAKQAIWFNNATQGATLFSGALAWLVISKFNLETAIVIDGISFAINGAIAFLIPNIKSVSMNGTLSNWSQKFKDLFTFNPVVAVLDILVVATTMGTVIYTSRIAGNDQSWIGIFSISYGLAVWISGFLERHITRNVSFIPFFLILGAGCILLGIVPTPTPLSFLVCFIRDCAFWILFHRTSGHIQHKTPEPLYGGVSSARTCIIVTIFSIGEYAVGVIAPTVSLLTEGIARASIAMCAIIFLLAMKRRENASERDHAKS